MLEQDCSGLNQVCTGFYPESCGQCHGVLGCTDYDDENLEQDDAGLKQV